MASTQIRQRVVSRDNGHLMRWRMLHIQLLASGDPSTNFVFQDFSYNKSTSEVTKHSFKFFGYKIVK